MSQRRMISLDVIDTDAFLDMPQSSQLLYFHLNARADDDGFVSNPKSIMRNSGAQSDDLKLLIIKKFIISFEDGVCVIKHWRINNFIRKDIYKETKYLDLKRTLLIRPNGAYTTTHDESAVPVPEGFFNLESVNVTSTKRQPSIGKYSIDKDSNTYLSAPADDTFERFWSKYPKKELKKKTQEIWNRKKLSKNLDEILSFIEKASKTDRWIKGYIKQPPAFLNGECWNDDLTTYGSFENTQGLKINKY